MQTKQPDSRYLSEGEGTCHKKIKREKAGVDFLPGISMNVWSASCFGSCGKTAQNAWECMYFNPCSLIIGSGQPRSKRDVGRVHYVLKDHIPIE